MEQPKTKAAIQRKRLQQCVALLAARNAMDAAYAQYAACSSAENYAALEKALGRYQDLNPFDY